MAKLFMLADVVEAVATVYRRSRNLELVSVQDKSVGLEYAIYYDFYFSGHVRAGVCVVYLLNIASADRRKPVGLVFTQLLRDTRIHIRNIVILDVPARYDVRTVLFIPVQKMQEHSVFVVSELEYRKPVFRHVDKRFFLEIYFGRLKTPCVISVRLAVVDGYHVYPVAGFRRRHEGARNLGFDIKRMYAHRLTVEVLVQNAVAEQSLEEFLLRPQCLHDGYAVSSCIQILPSGGRRIKILGRYVPVLYVFFASRILYGEFYPASVWTYERFRISLDIVSEQDNPTAAFMIDRIARGAVSATYVQPAPVLKWNFGKIHRVVVY